MLSYNPIEPLGVNAINKRLFIVVIVIIGLVGSTGILYYSLSQYHNGDAAQAPAAQRGKMRYVGSVGSAEQLSGPLSLATGDDLLFVTDSGRGRLVVFSKVGAVKRTIDLRQMGENPYPLGVAIDDKRRVYIAASTQSGASIGVFDAAGRYLYDFPGGAPNGAGSLNPGKAVGMFFANERLYVTDVVDHDVKVYRTDGALVAQFGRPGNAKGEFMYPNGVTADSSGAIYVSDSNNARVQVFTERGEFSHLFAPPKRDPLALPRGIALDGGGRVHVVDALKHKVFVFTKQGAFLFAYGALGTGDGMLSYPNGVAVDEDGGTVFIADKMNDRISVWR